MIRLFHGSLDLWKLHVGGLFKDLLETQMDFGIRIIYFHVLQQNPWLVSCQDQTCILVESLQTWVCQ